MPFIRSVTAPMSGLSICLIYLSGTSVIITSEPLVYRWKDKLLVAWKQNYYCMPPHYIHIKMVSSILAFLIVIFSWLILVRCWLVYSYHFLGG